ncbi:MAG: Cof-type HAD-IIB family hydrolase [Bacteroidales bacterium]
MTETNKTQYKLLVLDLDGTLTNKKKEITQTTKEALRKAQEKGIKIVLASGRPTYGIVPLAEEISLAQYEGYILSYNGGNIIDWATKRLIHEKELSLDTIPQLYDMAQSHGVDILSYIGEDIVTENTANEYVQHEAMLNKMPLRQVESFTEVVNQPVAKCLIVGDGEKLIPLEAKMKARFGEIMNIYRSEPFFLELMPQNIDKANSLQILLDHLGMCKEEMIACGDGYNDLSMIQFAGLGVAMANAQPEVKEAANYITLSNEEDGVAHVINEFIL